jgi:hypothetical protein
MKTFFGLIVHQHLPTLSEQDLVTTYQLQNDAHDAVTVV